MEAAVKFLGYFYKPFGSNEGLGFFVYVISFALLGVGIWAVSRTAYVQMQEQQTTAPQPAVSVQSQGDGNANSGVNNGSVSVTNTNSGRK